MNNKGEDSHQVRIFDIPFDDTGMPDEKNMKKLDVLKARLNLYAQTSFRLIVVFNWARTDIPFHQSSIFQAHHFFNQHLIEKLLAKPKKQFFLAIRKTDATNPETIAFDKNGFPPGEKVFEIFFKEAGEAWKVQTKDFEQVVFGSGRNGVPAALIKKWEQSVSSIKKLASNLISQLNSDIKLNCYNNIDLFPENLEKKLLSFLNNLDLYPRKENNIIVLLKEILTSNFGISSLSNNKTVNIIIDEVPNRLGIDHDINLKIMVMATWLANPTATSKIFDTGKTGLVKFEQLEIDEQVFSDYINRLQSAKEKIAHFKTHYKTKKIPVSLFKIENDTSIHMVLDDYNYRYLKWKFKDRRFDDNISAHFEKEKEKIRKWFPLMYKKIKSDKHSIFNQKPETQELTLDEIETLKKEETRQLNAIQQQQKAMLNNEPPELQKEWVDRLVPGISLLQQKFLLFYRTLKKSLAIQIIFTGLFALPLFFYFRKSDMLSVSLRILFSTAYISAGFFISWILKKVYERNCRIELKEREHHLSVATESIAMYTKDALINSYNYWQNAQKIYLFEQNLKTLDKEIKRHGKRVNLIDYKTGQINSHLSYAHSYVDKKQYIEKSIKITEGETEQLIDDIPSENHFFQLKTQEQAETTIIFKGKTINEDINLPFIKEIKLIPEA